MMKVIIIGACSIGTTCLTQIAESGHKVVIIDSIDQAEHDYTIRDVVLERHDLMLATIHELSERVVREEEMTHTFFCLIRKTDVGKVFGLYGKVSPRRGGVY